MKEQLRKVQRQRRGSMNPAEVFDRSEHICRRLFSWNVYQEALAIMAYYPLGNEADIRPVLTAALKEGKSVALPKVTGAHTMVFYEIKDFHDLERGAMKIMEPGDGCPVFEPVGSHALMLVPGLAFCHRKEKQLCGRPAICRLGYGGGFYDAYLSSIGAGDLTTCGVAYDFQVLSEGTFAPESHDRDLQWVVTDCGISG